jgi:hypothetical protein
MHWGLIKSQIGIDTTSFIEGRSSMIIQEPQIKMNCPECGSENVQSKLSFTNIVAWVGKLLGVSAVKIF